MVDTRRTHIVRVVADKKNPDDTYADIEVLDALAFRGPMGKELVLNFKQANVEPWIDDDTGGGNEKHPDNATRRSHMERISDGKHGKMDIEVLDCIAFRTQNGEEWILNLPSKKASAHSTNDTSDGGDNTRRTHVEKISEDFKKNPKEYVKVTRTDQVAFRTIMGKEMIIKMPSCDDPNSSDPRAETFVVSPKGYDPTNEDGPKPPLNTDKNVYVSFPKDGNPFTMNEKVSQGMLWWIRKVKSGAGIVYLTFEYKVSADSPKNPVEPKPKLTMLPFDENLEYQIFDDIYQQVDPAHDLIDVVNPVSVAMRSGLYQWTPTPAWVERKTEGGDPTIVYFVTYGPAITAENAFEPYPGTDQCGTPSTFGSAFGGSFFNCNSAAIAEAAANGFTNTAILTGGLWGKQEDAQYTANALNSLLFFQGAGLSESVVSVLLAPAKSVITVESRAVFALNIGKLKTFAEKDATTFKFKVVVPTSPDGAWKLQGSVYKTEKDFPLDAKNKPTFEFKPDDKVEKPGTTGKTTITATVDFKDFTIKFTSETEDSSEVG